MTLTGEMQARCGKLLGELCEAEGVKIIKGVVSKDHVCMYISYPTSTSIDQLVDRLKRRSLKKLQRKFPELRKSYLKRDFWASDYACWSNSRVTDDLLKGYLESHRQLNEEEWSEF